MIYSIAMSSEVVTLIHLSEMRIKRNMTQEQLATAAGVSQQAICFIEIGKRKNPGIFTMLKLARALRCSVYDLIEEKEGA